MEVVVQAAVKLYGQSARGKEEHVERMTQDPGSKPQKFPFT